MSLPNTDSVTLDDLRRKQEQAPKLTPTPLPLARDIARAFNGPLGDSAVAALQADEASRKELLRHNKLHAQIAADFGARYSPERATLARFEAQWPAQLSVKARMERIGMELPALVDAGRGIVWYGSFGTGKDHLMAALLYQAAKLGISCRRFNGQDFFGMMRDRMSDDLKEEEVFKKYTEPQILAISDPVPPASALSAFRLETLARLVNRRYEMCRGTWVTMNANTVEEAEGYLGSRIWDRLQESAELIQCLWPSYREKKGASR